MRFSQEEVRRAVEVVVNAGGWDRRKVLLAGVPSMMQASLPTSKVPIEQLHSDFIRLLQMENQRHAETWLRNAAEMVQSPDAELLHDLIRRLRKDAASTDAPDLSRYPMPSANIQTQPNAQTAELYRSSLLDTEMAAIIVGRHGSNYRDWRQLFRATVAKSLPVDVRERLDSGAETSEFDLVADLNLLNSLSSRPQYLRSWLVIGYQLNGSEVLHHALRRVEELERLQTRQAYARLERAAARPSRMRTGLIGISLAASGWVAYLLTTAAGVDNSGASEAAIGISLALIPLIVFSALRAHSLHRLMSLFYDLRSEYEFELERQRSGSLQSIEPKANPGER